MQRLRAAAEKAGSLMLAVGVLWRGVEAHVARPELARSILVVGQQMAMPQGAKPAAGMPKPR